MVLTKKEKQLLRILATDTELSINEVARKSSVSPAGAFKILGKFAKEGVLKTKTIANSKTYRFDFKNEKTISILTLAFIPEALEGRINARAEDLKRLKEITTVCIMFGSYITQKKEPEDLDLLFVVEKQNYEKYKNALSRVQDITPIRIHDVVQTNQDFEQNLQNKDSIVIEALRHGIVLWGFNTLIEVIKNANK